MILQRLCEYYDRLIGDPKTGSTLPKPGYSLQKVGFCVVLESDGRLQQFQSLLDSSATKPVPRQLLVPGQSKASGSGINPCFLWDNAAYLLGFKPADRKPERTRESFEAFRSRHVAAEAKVASPAFGAVCNFLRNWTPERTSEHAAALQDIAGSFGVFRIAGEQRFVHDDPLVVEFWAKHDSADAEAEQRGHCLVTGQMQSIARLHEPKIKGVRDAKSSGALLVSFNDNAYESFGKEQSYNAPVSSAVAFKYANALNHLLAHTNRRLFLGDATVVFWTSQPTALEDFVSDLLGDAPLLPDDAPPEDLRRAEQVRLFLSQCREGHAGGDAFDAEDQSGFYILALSPNASRVSVRLWEESTVGAMKARLAQHVSDTNLVGARGSDPPLTIRRIALAAGRAETHGGRLRGYDADTVSPLLAGSVARAVLTGGPYPQMLLGTMLNRMRADGVISHERVAAVKACIVRNSRLQGNQTEVSVALDSQRTDSAYVTGRLFALLEKIQSDSAGGDLNATIKDRFFSAASATPSIAFPRLIRLSQHHLAKMGVGQKIYHERQLGEVMGKLDGFAHRLNLQEQGLFAIGYYHQQRDLYTRRSTDEGDVE